MTTSNERDIYESIGEFCIEFEHVCKNMEACVITILAQNGLTSEPIQTVLLSGLAADGLRTLLQRLIAIGLQQSNSESKIVSLCFNKIQELIAYRNDIIHSKWFVFLKKEEDEFIPWANGEKLYSNKNGPVPKRFSYSVQDFKEGSEQCRECYIIISLIIRCLLKYRTITECFTIKEKNLVINYHALKPDLI